MAFSNHLSRLLNKIENRLGVKMLNLPNGLDKEAWAEVIMQETMLTFSRYYPHRVNYVLKKEHKGPDGYHYIDEAFCEDLEILGAQDLDWEEIRESGSGLSSMNSYIDPYTSGGFASIAMRQMQANLNSLTNFNRVFVEYLPPNKFKVSGHAGNSPLHMSDIPIYLLVVHPSLLTITPTKMQIVEDLAICDVAMFLYQNLKYYNGLSTVYSDVDLKLDDIKNEADKRDEIINKLEESYVSSSNDAAPIIWTV